MQTHWMRGKEDANVWSESQWKWWDSTRDLRVEIGVLQVGLQTTKDQAKWWRIEGESKKRKIWKFTFNLLQLSSIFLSIWLGFLLSTCRRWNEWSKGLDSWSFNSIIEWELKLDFLINLKDYPFKGVSRRSRSKLGQEGPHYDHQCLVFIGFCIAFQTLENLGKIGKVS
jgi:hypothetical protein